MSVNAGDGTLSIIDTTTGNLRADISTISVGASPEAIALYSAGAFNRAFVTHSALNAITVTDINDDPNNPNRYKVIQTARTGPQPRPHHHSARDALGRSLRVFYQYGQRHAQPHQHHDFSDRLCLSRGRRARAQSSSTRSSRASTR
jgi:YVTN family beta-propeller protein